MSVDHPSSPSILFSGIQPSGPVNIGNYVGALRHWVQAQKHYRCFFALVDLHAITVPQDPPVLRARCYDLLAWYIACGIDPEQSVLFMQSHVPAHVQLAWVLSCTVSSMGTLSRMTQFKDKARLHKRSVNVGLFTYPILMAADILLYRTHRVPVGHDQKQHLELARDIALRFNSHYGPIFTLPEPHIPERGARIMGLQTPHKKMSKSDVQEGNAIALLDPPEVIRRKIKRAVTDSGSEVCADPEKPGISNLLTLYAELTQASVADIEARYAGVGYGTFKKELAEVLVDCLLPIQERFAMLRRDEKQLQAILKRGAQQAKAQSEPVLARVYEAVGFIPGDVLC